MKKKENKSKSSKTSSAGTVSDKRIYIFIFAFCFLLYGNTIKNGFSLDDEYVSRNHEQVKKGLSGIPEIFTTYYTAGSKTTDLFGYRPIAKATYAIEYAFFGENPHVSHFINIILYALIGVIIFYLLRKWLRNYNIILPALITFLFLAHPIHTEVVASIKNRDVLLSFLGSIIMIHFILKYLEGDKFKYLLLGIFFCVFSYLSKPETPPAIVIIPFIVYFFTDFSVKKSIWLALFLIGFGLLVHFGIQACLPTMARSAANLEFYDNPLYFNKDWMIRLGVSFHSILYYLRMMFIHYPLLYYYGYNTIPIESFFNLIPIFSFILHLALGIFAFIKLKEKNIAAFGIIWYFLFISIIANLLSPAAGIIAERFIFGGSLGFCIVLAYYMLKLSKVNFESLSKRFSINSTFIFLSGIVFLLFTGQTISRNTDWKDHLTLYRHDIQYLDNSVKAHEMLGASLMKESNNAKSEQERAQIIDEAMVHYKRALEIHPGFAMGNNNLGAFYSNLYNDCGKAIPFFLKAIEVDSLYGEAYTNLALCYAKQNRTDEAIIAFEQGLKFVRGKFLVSYTTLLALYFGKGNIEKAKATFTEALQFFPNSEVPYREMAAQYLSKKDTFEAIKYFEPALKLKADPQLSNYIQNYFLKRGDTIRAKNFSLKTN